MHAGNITILSRWVLPWERHRYPLTSEQSLLMFVRKRDPRYKAHLKAQSQPATASSPANPQTLRTKTGPATVYIEQEWQKTNVSGVDDLEWALAEGNDDPEVFECVACGKSFKSEAAWNSHERSKKHIKNVEALRREMEEEAVELDLTGLSEELGPEPAEGFQDGRSGGSVTPPSDDGSGTEYGTPRSAQESPEPRAQVPLVEGVSPGGVGETEQIPPQSGQKLSKRDKRKLREAKKQAQVVEDKQVNVRKSRADIGLTIGHRYVTFAKQNSRVDRSCSITSEIQATRLPGQSRTLACKRSEREGNSRGRGHQPMS